jgi:4,5-dihydroxyphthalate decarboxylase
MTPWQCGYLADQGADVSKITFVSNDAEHNGGYHADAPGNVVYHKGADLNQMLASGEIAAAFGIQPGDNPDFVQLNPNAAADGVEQFKRDHVSTVIHLVTIRDEVIAANPWILQATYDAFKESKALYVAEKGPFEPWADPLPMGLDNMRPSIEKLQQLCVDIGILERVQDTDDLFPGNLN